MGHSGGPLEAGGEYRQAEGEVKDVSAKYKKVKIRLLLLLTIVIVDLFVVTFRTYNNSIYRRTITCVGIII